MFPLFKLTFPLAVKRPALSTNPPAPLVEVITASVPKPILVTAPVAVMLGFDVPIVQIEPSATLIVDAVAAATFAVLVTLALTNTAPAVPPTPVPLIVRISAMDPPQAICSVEPLATLVPLPAPAAPSADGLLSTTVPLPPIEVAPVYVFVPPKLSVAVPAVVNPAAPARIELIAPLALLVIVGVVPASVSVLFVIT